MSFQFPEQLPYAYDALEPHIDRETMEIHHSRHHRTYYDKLLAALKEETPQLQNESIENILSKVSQYAPAIRNHGGGYYNHCFFWQCLSPQSSKKPLGGSLSDAMNKQFGNFEAFQSQFAQKATSLFGSGFTWLMLNNSGELLIHNTPNQDNPCMDCSTQQGKPLLALDVWEHAYYLKYQNKRPNYIQAWWEVVNWERAQELYEQHIRS